MPSNTISTVIIQNKMISLFWIIYSWLKKTIKITLCSPQQALEKSSISTLSLERTRITGAQTQRLEIL